MSDNIVELPTIGDATDLLQSIAAPLISEDDTVQLERLLTPTFDLFLNLLKVKARSQSSRAIIQSGSIVTQDGTITLDQVPDVAEVICLSDELQLDELTSLAYILAAHEQSGSVSAAAAAGVYYQERLASVQSLTLLLHAQVTGSGALLPDVYATVATFNAALLSKVEDGKTTLLHRLADLIQQSSIAPDDASRLPHLVDTYGRVLDRTQVFQRECTALCHALLYACCIKQRMTASDIGRLLEILRHLVLHSQRAGAQGYMARHQANLVLLALMLTLLPLEDAQGDALAQDDEALRSLSKDKALESKLKGLDSGADSAYAAACKLAWGVVTLCCDEGSASPPAVEDVRSALNAGVLNFLTKEVMGSVPMTDETEDIRFTAASVVHQLLLLLLEVGAEGIEELKERSLAGAAAERDDPGTNTAAHQGGDFLMGVDQRGHVETPIVPDSIGTLLTALAAVLNVNPALLHGQGSHSQLGPFLSRVAADEKEGTLMRTPSVFLGYMEVLSAVASTEAGARMVFAQLSKEHAPPTVSWGLMFTTLAAIIHRYEEQEGAENGTGGRQAISHIVMTASDSKGMCAFIGLFERVMRQGAVDEVASWVRQLDSEAGVAPSWELLFQAMCCPVPQDLKASLDSAISALARHPDLAAALWERLLAAVVIMPYGGGADTGVPRYDLSYQLNEIEARAEDYSEAVAFVRLLTELWRTGGPNLADDGRPVAHFTRFVREELLATAFQRTFSNESQRWDLIASCLDHCRVCLETLALSPAALAADLSSSALVRPPGLDVLLDLLGEQSAARAALTTLSLSVERMDHERHSTAAGAAKEAAVLAALRLLQAGFQRDADFVSAARRSLQRGAYDGLESMLRHDRARIPVLLEYVRYPHNSHLQEEAMRLAHSIARRIPNLVSLLLTMPADGTAVPIAYKMQDSFAAYLHDALSAPTTALWTGSGGGSGSDEDQRASLILDLLTACLEGPTPNFTQLLCGFDMDAGVTPLALHDPRALHTPLRVVFEVLSQPRMATTHPRIFEQCLELVYELSASYDTGPAMLDLLRGYHSSLVPLVADVACSQLPNAAFSSLASLHQRAWLLQLLALQLHSADTAIVSHREGVERVLRGLFGSTHDDDSGLIPQGRGHIIDILAIASRATPVEPQLEAGASMEVRRMLQALDVEALLATPQESLDGSMYVFSARGDIVIDVIALKDELLVRYNDWVGRHGAPPDALKEAGRAALSYAADFNAYVERLGGQSALLSAWRAVVVVAFSRRFDVLGDLAGSSTRTTDLVISTAEDTLDAAAFLLRGTGAGLAPALCSSAQALFARLQEHIMASATSDPLAGMPLPPRCHSLLNALLSVMWDGRSQEAVRLPLYSALVSYLAMSNGPGLLHAPPAVLTALLDGVRSGAGSGAAEQLDAAQMQLEEGNVAALHSSLHVLGPLAADAVSPSPAVAAAALTALAALVGYDPTTVIADEIHRSALPARLLQDLQDQPTGPLATPSSSGQAVTLVAEAQLTLLLRLALAGPSNQRAASAQKLFALQALPRLAACRTLDLQPEEPGFTSGTTSGTSLRHRLHLLVTPTLRLVLSIFTALPHSPSVREQTAGFVEAHARTLARILRDAASPGVRGWEPADAELDEAALVMQLLGELVPHFGLLSPGVAPQLQEASFRAACRFLVPNVRCQSPPVVRIAVAREAGVVTVKEERTYAKVLVLRSALAAYLRALSLGMEENGPVLLPVAPGPASPDAASVTPTLFLIMDALIQAAVHDLPEVLGDQSSELRTLRSGDARSTEEIVHTKGWGTPGKGGALVGAAARAALVRAASLHQADVGRLVFLIEHLLAVLYQHLKIGALARQTGASIASIAALRPSNAVSQTATDKLGSAKDLDQLRRLMEPAIAALERMVTDAGLPGDSASLEMLIRRTKESLMAV